MSKSAFKLRSGNTTTFKKMGSTPQPGDSPVDFNWKTFGSGAGKGAKVGSAFGPWGAVIGGVIGGGKSVIDDWMGSRTGDNQRMTGEMWSDARKNRFKKGVKGGKNTELIAKLEEEDQVSGEVEEVLENRKDNKELLI